jgi:translation initiation factor IF-3
MSQKKPFKEKKHKINSEVRFPQVRVIGDGEPQLMSSFEASKLAQSLGKDLILINEHQNPPIVKIEDYNKFIYNLEKAEKEKKKNTIKSEIKEIQLSCEIASNDLQTKARKAKEFIEDGDKVRLVLPLKGRQKQMSERGESVLERFYELLSDICIHEDLPKLEGSKWTMTIKAKRK